jgi:hypothetical protein
METGLWRDLSAVDVRLHDDNFGIGSKHNGAYDNPHEQHVTLNEMRLSKDEKSGLQTDTTG